MPFSASYDRTTRIISIVVCALLAAVIVLSHNVVIAGLSILALALWYLYSPLGYAHEGQTLVIRRPIGNVRLDLTGAREARRTTPSVFTGCIRLWGSGGLFGYYGVFSTSALGRSTWYMTNRQNGVVLVAAAKTVLVSPDDPEAFLRAVPVVSTPASTREPNTPPRSTFGIKVALGIAVALAALGIVAVGIFYSPGTPRYTLTADSLTIHDRFYPVTLAASEVNVDGIRIVDLNQNTEWRPVVRTNGFANAHYRSGWFALRDGTKVRLYRADSSVVVLLPPATSGSTPVLYQVADPEAFVREVRAAWLPSQRLRNAGK